MISLSLRGDHSPSGRIRVCVWLVCAGFYDFLQPHDANEVLSGHNSVADSRQLVICGTATFVIGD